MELLKNRIEAGKLMAQKLSKGEYRDAVLLALPRGGVPVAHEIATALGFDWDILLVKKIGAPGHPEYAIGAVSLDGEPTWNEQSLYLNLDELQMNEMAQIAYKKVMQLARKWPSKKNFADLRDKTVIIVDDGLATGMSMRAAVDFLSSKDVQKIVIAVPVASRSSVEFFKASGIDVVALQTPEPFFSVGQWYEDFTQVTDETVSAHLSRESDRDKEGQLPETWASGL